MSLQLILQSPQQYSSKSTQEEATYYKKRLTESVGMNVEYSLGQSDEKFS